MDNQVTLQDKPSIHYTLSDTVFAWISFLLGYLFIKMFFTVETGVGAFASALLLCIAPVVYFAVKGVKQSLLHFVYVAFTVALSSILLTSDNGFLKFLCTCYVIISTFFYMYFTAGSESGSFPGAYAPLDVFKSLFVMPFSKFAACFPAAFNNKREKKGSFRFWHLIIGLIIAIIPTVIVLMLLYSADEGFAKLLDIVKDKINFSLFKDVFWIILGIPFAMYIFGALYANLTGACRNVMTEEQDKRLLSATAFMPEAMSYAAVTPVCVIYLIFLIVQSSYFFGGFAGIVPENLSLAQYARSGFFELCAVAVINLLIICAMLLFTKRKGEKTPTSLKIYSILLSFFTLVLIAIAISKMIVYIDGYGLTLLRVYVSWFMVLLAFVFIFIIIKMLADKFKYFLSMFLVFIALFSALCFSDVDACIAKYNVNAYVSGKHESIDVVMFFELSDSAVKYIIPLAEPIEGKTEEQNSRVTESVKSYLSEKTEQLSDKKSIFSFNADAYEAKRLLEEYNAKSK